MSGPYRSGDGTPPAQRRPHWVRWGAVVVAVAGIGVPVAWLNAAGVVHGGQLAEAAVAVDACFSIVVGMVGVFVAVLKSGEGWWQ